MATLLLWLGLQPGAIDEDCWQALERRALARAPGVASHFRSDRLRILCIQHRIGAPAPLRRLAADCWLLADLGFDATDASLVAGVQDTPAAVMHVDPGRGRLRLLRDRLGQRPLVWTRVRDGLLAASGEHILLAHPQVDPAWDRDFLAAYFGAAAPPEHASAFRAIRTLAPGECLQLDAGGQSGTISPLEPDPAVARLAEAAVVDRMGQLLRAAVAQDARDARRIGISLSGGLDSGSVAALLPGAGDPRALALSYGCDQLHAVDERPLAQSLAQQLGIGYQGFAVDDLAPLMPSGERPVCADTPVSNPYREIKCVLYRHARAAGVDVLLTGHFGDHLQPEGGDWLRSAWHHRGYATILARYAGLLRRGGPLALWRDRGWRRWLRGQRAAATPAAWLRREWQVRLRAAHAERLQQRHAWPQPAQAAHALGSYAAVDAAAENYFAAQFGIDLRHPYRALELVRFALSLPAHLATRPDCAKWAVRAAMAGRLPEPWRMRPKSTSMQPLFDSSVRGSQRARVAELIEAGRVHWSEFVDPAAVETTLDSGDSGLGGLLAWILAGFGLWIPAQASGPG